jgi:hypothetical protein
MACSNRPGTCVFYSGARWPWGAARSTMAMAFQGAKGQGDVRSSVLVSRRSWGAGWRSQAASTRVGRVRGRGGKAAMLPSATARVRAGELVWRAAVVQWSSLVKGDGERGAWVDGTRRRSVASRACRCAPWRVLDVVGASRSRRCRVVLRPGLG